MNSLEPTRAAVFAVCFAGALTVARAASAQAVTTETRSAPEGDRPLQLSSSELEHNRRALGGHLFIPSELVLDPFAATFFRSSTGAGVASASGPDFNLNVVKDRTYSQAAFSQAFEMQFGLFPWLAARLGGSALIFSGVNTASVVALGATVAATFSAGLTLSLPFTSWFRAGALFDVETGPGYGLTIADALRASIAAKRIVQKDTLNSGNSTTLQPGLALAFTLHRSLGLILDAHYVAVSGSFSKFGGDDDSYALGAALDFDLGALSTVPLGIQASFRWRDPWTGQLDADKQTELGFYYTARASLVLGLVGALRVFPQQQEFDTTVKIIRIVMRYYW